MRLELQTSDLPADIALSVDKIRVLDIAPACSPADDEPMVCSLRHIKLPQRTNEDDNSFAPWLRRPPTRELYYTLSYTWGKTHPDGSHLTNTIISNDALLRITANLHSALKQIRRLQGSTAARWPIWIDALCINQEDLKERSEQVRQMDRIYQLSATVLIWPGEVADDEERRFMRKLSSICLSYPDDELDPDKWERNRILGRKTPFDGDDCQAMLKFLRRP